MSANTASRISYLEMFDVCRQPSAMRNAMMGKVKPPAPSRRHSKGKGSESANIHDAWLQVMPMMAMTFSENDEMPRVLPTKPLPPIGDTEKV